MAQDDDSDGEIVANDLLITRPVRSDSDQRISSDAEKPESPPPLLQPVTTLPDNTSLDLVFDKIIQIIIPVTLCALYSCIMARILSWNLSTTLNILDKTWKRFGVSISLGSGDSESMNSFTNNLTIVTIFCLLIVGVTLIILLIFYLEWHRYLTYYFYLPSLIIMAIVTPAFMREILTTLDWFPLDLLTFLVLLWNFTILGMVSIFGIGSLRAPMLCQQFYLIHNSAMMALLIIHILPGWAPWLLLAFLVLWDLFAVLAPMGPLNLIINMAEREGMVEMPGLIYSTDLPPPSSLPPPPPQPGSAEARNNNTNKNRSLNDDRMLACSQVQVDTIDSDSGQGQPMTPPGSEENKIEEDQQIVKPRADAAKSAPSNPMNETSSGRLGLDERGVSIGLGDFIFYSLLITLTTKDRTLKDFYATLATLNALLVGLILTLATLALSRRALPALPISIGLGVVVASLTINLADKLANRLASEAIFV